MGDPFGTKKLSEEMQQFNGKLASLIDTMETLGQSTSDLSNYSQKLSDSLGNANFAPMVDEMKGMRLEIKEMKESMQKMGEEMSQNLGNMNKNIEKLSNTFETQMIQLVATLNKMGNSLSEGMIANVRENLSINKIIPGFLKTKKDE